MKTRIILSSCLFLLLSLPVFGQDGTDVTDGGTGVIEKAQEKINNLGHYNSYNDIIRDDIKNGTDNEFHSDPDGKGGWVVNQQNTSSPSSSSPSYHSNSNSSSNSSNSSSNRSYFGNVEGVDYYDWDEYNAALADKKYRTVYGYTYPTREKADEVRQAYREGRIFNNWIYPTKDAADAARAEEETHWFDGRRFDTKEQAEAAHYFKGKRYNSFNEIEEATREYNAEVQERVNYLVNGGGKQVVYTNNTNSPLRSSRPIVYQPNISSNSPLRSSRPIVNQPNNDINSSSNIRNRSLVYNTDQINGQEKRDPNDEMLDKFEAQLSKNQYLEDWKIIGMSISGFSYGILEEGTNVFTDQFNLGYKLLGPYYFLDPKTGIPSLMNTNFMNDIKIVGEEFSWGAIRDYSSLDMYKGYTISIGNPTITSLKNTLFNFLYGDAENRGRATFQIGKMVYDYYGVGKNLTNPSQFLEDYSKKSAFGKLSDAYDDASTLTSPITDQIDKKSNDNNSK